MATHVFECPEGHSHEHFFRTLKADRTRKCPECGKKATRIVSAGSGIIFKGSGFFATDYRGKP